MAITTQTHIPAEFGFFGGARKALCGQRFPWRINAMSKHVPARQPVELTCVECLRRMRHLVDFMAW